MAAPGFVLKEVTVPSAKTTVVLSNVDLPERHPSAPSRPPRISQHAQLASHGLQIDFRTQFRLYSRGCGCDINPCKRAIPFPAGNMMDHCAILFGPIVAT